MTKPVVLAAVLIGTTSLMSAAPRPDTPQADLARLLASAGTYVARFTAAFANAVTEETYTQELAHAGPDARSLTPMRRVLRSEFLLLQTTASDVGWLPFRNVLAVNGRAVRNGNERLAALLASSSADALARAQRISAEWTRYNIGPDRTINSPVLALLFLQADMQSRFRFRRERSGRDVPAGVSVVSFEETAVPTVIRVPADRGGPVEYLDSPASGQFWIDADGTVLRSELVIRGGSRRALGLAAPGRAGTFTTRFQRDDERGIAVPAEMREWLSTGDEVLTGTAVYSAFTTFSIDTDAALSLAPRRP